MNSIKPSKMSRILALLLPCLYLSPLATMAAPGILSNTPLFATTSAEPNVLFVLDDSGSMDADLMTPEGEITTNIPYGCGSGCEGLFTISVSGGGKVWYGYTTNTSDNAYGDLKVPTQESVNSTYIKGAWLARTSAYNRVYYNPAVNYTPWAGVDNSGAAYADANASKAKLNPYLSSSSTVNLTSNQTISTRRPNYTSSGFTSMSFTYMPMRYWVWIDDNPANGKIDATDSHRLIEIKPTTSVCGTSATATEQYNNQCMLRSYADEKKNFANWWQYHRRREYAMKHAMSHIIAPTTGVRMGMFTINSSSSERREIKSMNADPASGNKRSLLNTLFSVHSYSGTPLKGNLKKAGEYYNCSGTNVFNNSNCPIQKTPVSPATQAAGECQQNFTVLMTDGYYTDGSISGIGNDDNDGTTWTGVNPVTTTMQSWKFDGAPYNDSRYDTLADIAMHYYERDLISTLANKVPMQCGVDENPGQHMVTYTVAFGVEGLLKDSDIPDHPRRGYAANCTATTATAPAWTNPSSQVGKIDDLRHAAYNGRGEYYSATDSQKLLTSLLSALKSIVDRTGAASAVAFNSSTLDTKTKLYLALFSSTKWSGDLQAYGVNASNGEVNASKGWSAANILDARTSTRVMMTYSGTDGVALQWTNLTASQKGDLKKNPAGGTDNDATGMARLGYLRGDRACEIGNPGTCSYNDGTNTFTSKLFRVRDSKLGDIVHSDPVFIGKPEFGYPDTAPFPSTTGSKYSEYVAANDGRLGIVYVGANDGALHGFREDTGEEVLAYMPSFLFSSSSNEGLHYLTDPAYNHRYYVDLPTTRADVFIKTSTTGSQAWRSIIVGGSRAGGRGIFALDVSNPAGFTEVGTTPSDIVLWEFTNADDNNLGYTFSKPQIYLMNNGKWAVVIGNGYNDTGTGEAQLFILFLDTNGALTGSWTLNTDYVRITTKSGTTSDRNGLSTPALIDVDDNGTIDRIYAGDIKGNLWVFDVSDADPTNWKSAYKKGASPEPLFKTQSGRPITTELEVMSHPTEPNTTSPSNAPNLMILFGTGQYLVDGDKTNTDTQSFYAVWDKGSLGSGGNAHTISSLIQQTFLTGFPANVRVTSDNPVDYASKYGWYIDLPTSGERVITSPILRGGIIFFNTTIPSVNPCEFGGSGWLMSLDTVNGGPPDAPVFDYTGDNVVDQADLVSNGGTEKYVPIGQKFDQGMPASPTILGNRQYTPGTKTTSGSTISTREIQKLSAGQTGRLSWEELLWQ